MRRGVWMVVALLAGAGCVADFTIVGACRKGEVCGTSSATDGSTSDGSSTSDATTDGSGSSGTESDSTTDDGDGDDDSTSGAHE